ncbi:MAG TPA: hypothetical protein PK156_41590, partial [Polyangium sp.]|nr:hypothetical protein [Polyangium sp.]
GREHLQENGKLETGFRVEQGGVSNFQGRYAIRHPWKGAIRCMKPKRGIWGGPPAGEESHPTQVAQDLAFAPRGQLQLASIVQNDVPEIGLSSKGANYVADPGGIPAAELKRGGCAGCFIGARDVTGSATWMAGIAGLIGVAGFVVRRNRKRRS